MAITFVEERKKQKKLLLVFGFVVAITVVVLVQGLVKRIPRSSMIGKEISPTFKKIEIDFTLLESNNLKDLEPFEGIKPFEGKIGRENPFLPY